MSKFTGLDSFLDVWRIKDEEVIVWVGTSEDPGVKVEFKEGQLQGVMSNWHDDFNGVNKELLERGFMPPSEEKEKLKGGTDGK